MINELMKRLSELPNVTLSDGQEYIQLYDAMETVKRALEQEPKWIPVSEQLPKENSGYLVTVKRGYVTTALWVGNAEFWNEVTAWMPLPKPWKGEHDG